MKKKKFKKKLELNKKEISKVKGGAATPNPASPAKCSDSYYYYCTWEIDCPSVFYSCDLYCTIA